MKQLLSAEETANRLFTNNVYKVQNIVFGNRNFQIQNWNVQRTCRTYLVYSDIFDWWIPAFMSCWKQCFNECETQAHFYHQILILVWFSEVGGYMLNQLEFKGLPSMNSKTWIKNIYFKSHIQDNWVFQIRKSCSNFPLW